jgi:hypothetical protein
MVDVRRAMAAATPEQIAEAKRRAGETSAKWAAKL